METARIRTSEVPIARSHLAHKSRFTISKFGTSGIVTPRFWVRAIRLDARDGNVGCVQSRSILEALRKQGEDPFVLAQAGPSPLGASCGTTG